MVLDYIQHLISFGGLSILKKYRAHSYRRSSVVLICGLLSTQWHAVCDAVLVRDYTSADVVAYSRSTDELCKAVHKAVQLNTKIKM